MYKIIVTNSDGEVFAETEPITADELPGFLKIIDKPSMFGSAAFHVTVNRV